MKAMQAAWVAAVCVGAMAIVGRGQVDSNNQSQGAGGAAAVVVMNQPPSTTRLEAMLATRGAVIVRGYTDVGSVQGDDNSAFSVAAVELTEVGRGHKEYGLAVGVKQGGQSGISVLTYVDYDELDAITGAMDYLGRMDSNVTRLAGYEGRFKSKGDLEIANFADNNGTRMVAVKGTQVVPETGQVVFATAYFPLARLGDVKQIINTGRQTVDKVRDGNNK